MNSKSMKSTLIACIAVCLVAIIAMTVLLINGVNNNDTSSVDSSGTSTIDTADTSTTQSQTSSDVNSSKESSSSVISSTSSNSDLTSADDNPFESTSPSGELVCYLTFDDGPCKNTDTILKILADNDVKATFFVVGTMSTGKIKSIYDAGHAIGLHTNTHDLTKSSSKYVYRDSDSFFNDLQGISDVVYQKIGIRSNLTRFPGGSSTAKLRLGSDEFSVVKSTLKEKGYTYFDWNIDSGDTHAKSPSKEYVMNEIRKGLKSNGQLRSEVCILMHDIKNVTVEALPDIIKELKDLGYTFKSLDSTSNNFGFN